MKPVTVIVPLPPSYRGGTEEYAYRVVEQVSHHLPVRVVTTNVRWGHDAPPLDTGEAEVVALPGTELFERPVLTSATSRARLNSLVEDSSLLHLHMPFPFVERRVTRRARRSGVPVVLTYHMDAHLGVGGVGPLVTGLYRRFSARVALTNANVVVSNSLGYARASPVLSEFLAKVRVIPKGIDPQRLGTARTPATPSGTDGGEAGADKRIVFVGRLVPYKGLLVLLEAVRRLRASGGRAHLYIAGRGPEQPRLERWVDQAGFREHVTFLGFVPDAQLGSLYRSADVVACPSLNMLESSPTALEEASSLGTPVVGSNLPGASESIPSDGRRGLLVAPGDPDAVADALGRMMAAPHWRPETIRTWEDVARDYEAVYAGLVPELVPRTRPTAGP
jgi:glycosyltransferase involved in cell wall biosynthesis